MHTNRIKIVFAHQHVYAKTILIRQTSHIEHAQVTSACALFMLICGRVHWTLTLTSSYSKTFVFNRPHEYDKFALLKMYSLESVYTNLVLVLVTNPSSSLVNLYIIRISKCTSIRATFLTRSFRHESRFYRLD